ncbi:MAG: hypothetical protein CML16_17455 [Pusillimonas sp.]|nr:hypothetical protein [Pusillimonas sp.]|tara:strand:+ start:2177 stop:2602 length:426 start_codon:yes stop_codon:yes gene_type:complete
MNDAYSPHTGEHIQTNDPAPWMGRAGVEAPEYDRATQGCFWRGDTWEVVAAVPDPGPVPETVTRRQGRLALLQTPHGEVTKLDAVEAALESISDPMQKRAAMIEYDADTWARNNAFLQAMWAQLGGTESELDSLFRTAATL